MLNGYRPPTLTNVIIEIQSLRDTLLELSSRKTRSVGRLELYRR